jgi:hypothetical protein
MPLSAYLHAAALVQALREGMIEYVGDRPIEGEL